MSDFWPPNVNEGPQNCDPVDVATPYCDCFQIVTVFYSRHHHERLKNILYFS